MHMADALISPAVGGTMLAVSAGAAFWSAHRLRLDPDEGRVPLMGVMGAFVFAAQMINFAIPATGSSGHLGGGMLLAALLGPWQGFLTMASILLIQALFFGDGGLLAYGCNVFNLGFLTCLLVFPLVFRPIARKGMSPGRILAASMIASVAGLQLGAFGVVLETTFSGRTELPFGAFAMLMQPIHLAIGIVEGLVTAAVVTFVWKNRPEIFGSVIGSARPTEESGRMGPNGHAHPFSHAASSGHAVASNHPDRRARRRVLVLLALTAALIGGGLSWFASANPDGLEWAMLHAAGTTELASASPVHETLAALQEKTTLLPDYGFRDSPDEAALVPNATEASTDGAAAEESADASAGSWPAVQTGTSVSGLVGGAMTMLLTLTIGLGIGLFRNAKRRSEAR